MFLTGLSIICRRFGFSALHFKSHYDVLGVTPKATQADIKAAYYKLSMMYHPDKNKNSVDAANKFRDITAAYEVLGNYRLRKLYDKGVLHNVEDHVGGSTEMKEEDSETKFYQSRANRRQPPTASGRTPIYDFDEWTQAHYGRTFARREAAKARYEESKVKITLDKHIGQSETVLLGMALCICVYSALSFMLTDDNDKDNISKKETKE